MSLTQEVVHPCQCFTVYAVAKEFRFKTFVGHTVKRLCEVQDEHVSLETLINSFGPVVYYCTQLGYTATAFMKGMLSVRYQLLCLFEHSMCSRTLQTTLVSDTGRSSFGHDLSPFLYANGGYSPIFRDLACFKRLLKDVLQERSDLTWARGSLRT